MPQGNTCSGIHPAILASGTIAVIPIVSAFEDFFVINGVRFSEKLRFFLGTSKKSDISQVIEAYYGRMKETNLSWNTLTSMMRGMFSHDFGYEDHTNKVTNLDFYGNDGVCLFKYFVNRDDSQKFFVWTVLGSGRWQAPAAVLPEGPKT